MAENRNIVRGLACVVFVLLTLGVYFLVQCNRLSQELVEASLLIRQAAQRNRIDREYNLKREQVRIQATDEQLSALRVVLPGEGNESILFSDFVVGRNDERSVYMYFSSNVCEVCLYNEMEIQDSLYRRGDFDNRLTILAPKDYIQNLRAKFQGRTLPCDYVVVDYESFAPGSALRIMNEPLLFRWREGRARDIFVPSKINRAYSEIYYDYLNSVDC